MASQCPAGHYAGPHFTAEEGADSGRHEGLEITLKHILFPCDKSTTIGNTSEIEKSSTLLCKTQMHFLNFCRFYNPFYLFCHTLAE